jgi:ATP-dependent DNA helicase RecG
MALPVNIQDLISGRTVEWERIEFKAGWNPEDFIHSICAFANDINNWGGGYIILGIEEKKGRSLLPPIGLEHEQADAMQKKLVHLCHRITPPYFPVAAPVEFQGKTILVLWVPGGETRPYKAPVSLARNSPSAYYVRHFSSTIKVRDGSAEERQLYQLAAKVPFDDRINHQAELEDLNLTLIRAFLKEIGSELHAAAENIPFRELCRQMQIARGPDEYLKPVNVGLLLFNEQPDRFFRGARIEVIEYQDEVGDRFTEKVFTGPIHVQLRSALQYLKNNVVKEQVLKVPDRPEAVRFFNYPSVALEEALANAVYHRSYEHQSTIEVNVRNDCIEILSFPGPFPPIDNKAIKKSRVVSRDYRNRRIGDFLKEMHLTEGRSTGIPKIRRAMKRNGSPPPVFETDKDRVSFLTVLKIHPLFPINMKEDDASCEPVEGPEGPVKGPEGPVKGPVELTSVEREVLVVCSQGPMSAKEISGKLGFAGKPGYIKRALANLVGKECLEFTLPEKPGSRLQKYRITGKALGALKSG